MPMKILALDDSKTMRLAIKITFAAEDVEVVAIGKGAEALARAKQMAADVVLLDANFAAGEPSGYDICRALRADASTSNIPVIMMLPAHTGVDEGQLRACGADAAILKPFDTQELIDKVAGVVAKPRAVAASAARPAAAAVPRAGVIVGVAAPARAMATTRPLDPVETPGPSPRPAAVAFPQVRPTASPTPATMGATTATPASSATPPLGRAPAPIQPVPVAAQAHSPVGRAGDIPIAVPIPFVPASGPTPGVLRRLQEAGGVPGVDPKAAELLVRLSREVIEQIAWEIVPELAEQIIRAQRQA